MKKRLLLIFIMFVSFMSTSCIIHEWFNEYVLTGIVVGDIDEDGELEPIPGIQVYAYGYAKEYTDSVKDMNITADDGSFHLVLKTVGNPEYNPMGKVELVISYEDNGEVKTITRNTDFTKENSSKKGSYSFDFGKINLSD